MNWCVDDSLFLVSLCVINHYVWYRNTLSPSLFDICYRRYMGLYRSLQHYIKCHSVMMFKSSIIERIWLDRHISFAFRGSIKVHST